MDIYNYWRAALRQNPEEMKTYFSDSAYINWHNTDEHFTVDEFIRVNCEYPEHWDGEIQRIETLGDFIVTAVHVFATNKPLSFHVVSFIQIKNDKIIGIDEYWGDDGDAPQWRKDKQIGTTISGRI